MSTFFRSAAMSLLSRTLRSLLHKYLDDVDVEGVNLPSLYSSDGHAGWGVRLSNVRLKQGAQLMDLPGTIVTTNRRKRQRRRRKPRQGKPPPSPARRGRRQAQEPEGMTPRGGGGGGGVSGDNDDSFTTVDETVSTVGLRSGVGGGGAETSRPNAVLAASVDADDGTSPLAPPPPPPPVQLPHSPAPSAKRSTSWFSYFYGSSSNDQAESLTPTENNATTTQLPRTMHHVAPNSKHHPTREDEEEEVDVDDDGINMIDDDDDDNDDDEEHDADPAVTPPPMMLRLGPAGTIKTLDVRLVGKDIHVLVEDADLVVEIVPRENSKATTNGGAPPTGAAAAATATITTADDASSHRGGALPVAPPPLPPPPPPPPPATLPDAKTVGERVLRDNVLARIISMIPNLFLRDIRVRVVMQSRHHHDAAAPSEHDDSVDAANVCMEPLVELGIELLSVTDGEDFLANFRAAAEANIDDDDSSDSDDDTLTAMQNGGTVNKVLDDPYNSQLQYLHKRIRTGRGPEGGIVLRVFPMTDALAEEAPVDPPWARHRWTSACDFCMLRCSGLDVRARIFLGTKVEVAGTATVSDNWYPEYEDYTVDAMLFGGVDYIAPGAMIKDAPPLPPIGADGEPIDYDDEKFWSYAGATSYRMDENGILSSGVPSCFHRAARCLTPITCATPHLPCEFCARCWIAGSPTMPVQHDLDETLPMGGLVLHISTRDVLEINVERSMLESMALLLQLVKRPTIATSVASPAVLEYDHSEGDSLSVADLSERSASSTAMSFRKVRMQGSSRLLLRSESFDGMLSVAATPAGSRKGIHHTRRATDHHHQVHFAPPRDKEADSEEADVLSAYPSYMQPEKVQVLGLHVSELRCRVHIMSNASADRHAFQYWDVHAKCVTADFQTLTASPHNNFQDLRLDVGHAKFMEYGGCESRQLASIGVRQRVIEFDEITLETLKTRDGDNDRSPWPSTAAALLDMQPPLETLMYEERDRHAFQLRYVTVSHPNLDPDTAQSRSALTAWIGAATVNFPWETKDAIVQTVSEAKSIVLGPPMPVAATTPPTRQDGADAKDATLRYKVRLDGGHAHLATLVDVHLPLTTLAGEHSSSGTGVFLETLLERVRLSYGQRAPLKLTDYQRLSLTALASLSENVRLRILLFIKDLRPLEAALSVKPESNSFLRCRAINRQIARLAHRLHNAEHDGEGLATTDDKNVSRRQGILSELLKLDDDALEELWETHQASQRKAARMKSRTNRRQF